MGRSGNDDSPKKTSSFPRQFRVSSFGFRVRKRLNDQLFDSLRGYCSSPNLRAPRVWGLFERSAEETNCNPMGIGLFGGTFDPIHWGHLRSAEEVSETFELDRVVFVPASIPPHKRGQTTTPARDRLAMVRLAVARNPRFKVSTVEISRPGVSYSIDTGRHFDKRKHRGDFLFFFFGLS